MAMKLKDKVCIITGGADGIGYVIADKFLQKGAKVAVLLDIADGSNAAKNLCSKHGAKKAVYIKCDVTKDLDAISNKLIHTYKTVDVLVNSAGVFNDQLCKMTIDVNVKAVIVWSMKFWEHMRKDKGGKGGTIINLSSIYGYRFDQYFPFYQASKFAVVGFTKSLGHMYNFNRSGIRVVVLCPGLTDTKLVVDPKTWDDECLNKDFKALVKKQVRQKVEAVGNAAVEVFEKADSGTAWLIEGAQPIVQV